MFSRVAGRYDRANSVLSLGIHHLWRKKLVNWSGAQAGQKVLDCATGTGDLAIEFKKAVGAEGQVIGTDFCVEMMATAPAKAQAAGLSVQFQQADAMDLKFEDRSFDIVSISFGIRNVNQPVKALREMARVTKTGGYVMVLEFGKMNHPILGPLYNWYSEKVLPFLGGLITGQKEAYSYLQSSSAAFPCRDGFLKLMKEADSFTEMEFKPVSFGIAYIYRGKVK
jgi:demethylmenaquinone methyltransferase/2-methoxy-6-polyprenyl-1,4-benzoquinol methylase